MRSWVFPDLQNDRFNSPMIENILHSSNSFHNICTTKTIRIKSIPYNLNSSYLVKNFVMLSPLNDFSLDLLILLSIISFCNPWPIFFLAFAETFCMVLYWTNRPNPTYISRQAKKAEVQVSLFYPILLLKLFLMCRAFYSLEGYAKSPNDISSSLCQLFIHFVCL
jgi:hypothetical protein